jgi:hypothetical protein
VVAIAVGDLPVLMNRSSPGSDALDAICHHRLKKRIEIQWLEASFHCMER